MARAEKKGAKSSSPAHKKRSYLSQSDVPSVDLQEAIRVPRAIIDNYGGDPTSPLQVAKALDLTPKGGHFRSICGAAIAYGLTDGGPNASQIGLTELARRLIKPLTEGDDALAVREALLQPRVVGEFLRKYDGHSMPRDEIAYNVLEEMGVPAAKTKDVLRLIRDGAEYADLLQEIKGNSYVDLRGAPQPHNESDPDYAAEKTIDGSEDSRTGTSAVENETKPIASSSETQETTRSRRVFLTHGKNRVFLEPIKKLLAFGELEPVVATEEQSVAKPVPDKVLESMRSCGAAIIHVDAERKLVDQEAKEHVMLNPNVLIEIGASMALFGRRFILLVKEGVTLPSNLQGLYEVRYQGDVLDGNATIRLLEAINDIKNNPLP